MAACKFEYPPKITIGIITALYIFLILMNVECRCVCLLKYDNESVPFCIIVALSLQEYEFLYKPGNVNTPPLFVGNHC